MNETVTRKLKENFDSSIVVKQHTIDVLLSALLEAATVLISAYQNGNKAIFAGNGGSAADAQHLAAEFLGRYLRERKPLPALALTTNTSTVTAIGNDYGYDLIFSRQLEAMAVPGDVLIGISTSGNSANVVQAFRAAKRLGLKTIAMTGRSGGAMKELADVLLNVSSEETPRIQECHILIGHALCEAVESALS